MVDQTADLFGTAFQPEQSPRNFLCRNADISPNASSIPKYDGKWWEWQANRAIGGLLVPKPLLKKLVAPFTQPTSFGPVLKESLRGKASEEIAQTFDVNPVVARIRLQEIYPMENQPTL